MVTCNLYDVRVVTKRLLDNMADEESVFLLALVKKRSNRTFRISSIKVSVSVYSIFSISIQYIRFSYVMLYMCGK